MDAQLVSKAARRIQRLSKLRPALAIVLGSGFDHVVSVVKPDARLSYADIPGFPDVSVAGHAGELLVGTLADVPVILMRGRVHYYEGHSLNAVTFAMRVLAACGLCDVLLTNAAGGIRSTFRPGHFMALTDHINFMGGNPLRGPVALGRERFVDMTEVYDRQLLSILRRAGKQSRVRLHEGVYLAVSGPSYETPAEIRAFARLGADAVGMSTVPEAIVARQCELRVAGVSCITNLAAGRSRQALSHHEVLDTAVQSKESAAALMQAFVKNYEQAIQS